MIKKGFLVLLLAVFVVMFANFLGNYTPSTDPGKLANFYLAEDSIEKLGSANVVTAIVVTYRGLDTLGEVSVLFLVASILGFFLTGTKRKEDEVVHAPSELLKTASGILVPLTFLFGAYVFINGHLTPGGGFQGGAIIASGSLLAMLANPFGHFKHTIISVVESLSGVTYVLLGGLGMVLAAGFLDNNILLPIGKVGNLFSAGAIPLIYSLVGLKVGTELSAMLIKLRDTGVEQ
ncbi:sodium:proton antiporter [bacterium]|nr:sodium:proton antiporter [bacterium]